MLDTLYEKVALIGRSDDCILMHGVMGWGSFNPQSPPPPQKEESWENLSQVGVVFLRPSQ
jgi:hypothetical protein